jgi:hypothetical protein
LNLNACRAKLFVIAEEMIAAVVGDGAKKRNRKTAPVAS